MKVFSRKPHIWARVDDNDLYLMWILLKCGKCKWVKFIMSRIGYCRNSHKRSLFFSSFIVFILDLNDISSTDEYLVKAPKSVDSTLINLMCYFKYGKKVYYDLDNVGRLLCDDAKAYRDGLVSNILADSQIRETRLHAHIDLVAREAKEINEKILVELSTVKGVLYHLKDLTLMFNFNDIDATYDPSLDDLY
ncbi:hypothetical protein RYX36_008276 [Vicia faba]